MGNSGTPYLMYHEVEVPGRAVNQSLPGYLHYVVTSEQLTKQFQSLVAAGFEGVSVSRALDSNHSNPKAVVITFDDGCETDLLIAGPLLNRLGFKATFYVVSGFLNKPGYLSNSQLRELAGLGHEIGSHSISHRYLRQLDNSELRSEIQDSKTQLEQILGQPVEHFSCPGGRWDARVSPLAVTAGYRSVSTSEIGLNNKGTDPYRLKRLAVFRETSAESLVELMSGRHLLSRQIRTRILDGAKDVLGDERYDRVRSSVLHNLRRRSAV
jgi:peptidoglycan/xylan/chitin deacetylase (PgdA/CDA1 family)